MRFTKEEELEFTKTLEAKGYKRFTGHYKSEDYGYWKSFKPRKDRYGETENDYQLAILFYDFSKYPLYEGNKPVGTQFEYVGHLEEYVSRLDFSVSDDDVGIEEFEKLADHFYEQMIVNYVKKNFKERIEEYEEEE